LKYDVEVKNNKYSLKDSILLGSCKNKSKEIVIERCLLRKNSDFK